LTQDHPELAVLANGKALDENLDQLVAAVKKGDEPEAHVLLKHAKNKMMQQSMLAQVIAETTTDKQIRDELLLHAANIEDLTDMLNSAVNQTLANPQEMPGLMKVVNEIKTENHAIMDLSNLNIKRKKEEEERKRREEEERIRAEEEKKKKRRRRKIRSTSSRRTTSQKSRTCTIRSSKTRRRAHSSRGRRTKKDRTCENRS